MDPKPVKGCEDDYPQDFARRMAVFGVLRDAARSYGFEEVSTPALETIETLTKKAGEEMKQQLFVLEKKGSEQLGLRFDLTVPLTRVFIGRQKELPKPVKWFALDRMWRYEAPQKGRQREFYQLSVELFGSDRPEADAEVINLAIDCLKAFGLTAKDVQLRLNNRKVLEGLVAGIAGKNAVEGVIRIIDKKGKIREQEFIDGLLALSLDQQQAKKILEISGISGACDFVLAKLETLSLGAEAQAGLEELRAVVPLIPADFVTLDLSLARGLAYYTGNVFEVFDRTGEFRAILGGGRYDDLVGLFGGEKEAATGFAIGYSTLSLLLAKKGLLPAPTLGPEYFIAVLGNAQAVFALELAAKIRRSGFSAVTDVMGRKLDKQLKYANAVKAKRLIVIGPQEEQAGLVRVKDMQSGAETERRVADF